MNTNLHRCFIRFNSRSMFGVLVVQTKRRRREPDIPVGRDILTFEVQCYSCSTSRLLLYVHVQTSAVEQPSGRLVAYQLITLFSIHLLRLHGKMNLIFSPFARFEQHRDPNFVAFWVLRAQVRVVFDRYQKMKLEFLMLMCEKRERKREDRRN